MTQPNFPLFWYLHPSIIINSIPCDPIVQRAYWFVTSNYDCIIRHVQICLSEFFANGNCSYRWHVLHSYLMSINETFFCHLEQVDYPASSGKWLFILTCLTDKGPDKMSSKLRLAKWGKHYLKAAWPKGKLEFKVCSSHNKLLRAGNIAKWLTWPSITVPFYLQRLTNDLIICRSTNVFVGLQYVRDKSRHNCSLGDMSVLSLLAPPWKELCFLVKKRFYSVFSWGLVIIGQ